MAMNKYGRATKMTSPPPGMPAGLAKKYAQIEGQVSSIATMNRGIIDGDNLSSKGYDPNEMVEIEDVKTKKKTKVPFGSYEHQVYIAGPSKAEHFMGIGTKDAGVQRFRDKDLEAYNKNPWEIRANAGLKTTELRTSKGSTIFNPKTGEINTGGVYQQDYEKPIKGVTDLPSRYKRENEILTSYNKLKGDLSTMEEDFKKASEKLPTRPVKRDLPKLKGKVSGPASETTWENPEPKAYKTKREISKSREGGQDKKISPFSTQLVPKKGGGVRKMPAILVSKSRVETPEAKGVRYNREEKMAKAFYAPESVVGTGGYSSKTDDVWKEEGSAMVQQNVPKMIKSDIKNIRAEKRQYIADKTKGGKAIDAISGEAIGEYNKAIKTAKLASRYAKRADISVSGDETWKAGNKSKIKYFTPDYNADVESGRRPEGQGRLGAMSGYSAAGKQERSRLNYLENEAGYSKAFNTKLSKDNAVNRNSTSDRMKKFWGY